ncbi:hypothetical protein Hanom_Chr06g00574101 [Helianthus anomalus]
MVFDLCKSIKHNGYYHMMTYTGVHTKRTETGGGGGTKLRRRQVVVRRYDSDIWWLRNSRWQRVWVVKV